MSPALQHSLAPVWFIAHGGPPTLFEPNHEAHQHWLESINDIKSSNLKGIIFVSAHWQAERNDFINQLQKHQTSNFTTSILMNKNVNNPLIYDFYNFPKHFYDIQFNSKNSIQLQKEVSNHLKDQGYHVEEIDRGIDHGVWVPLRSAGENFDIPLLQISLPISKNPLYDGVAALRLGKALRGLRNSGYAIIGGGQPVHNLRDYMSIRSGYPVNGGHYGHTFSTALTQALSKTGDGQVTSDGDPTRWNDAKALFQRPDYLRAHPTSEHLLPVLVALGAAKDEEPGVEEFKLNEGPMAWNMYRFG